LCKSSTEVYRYKGITDVHGAEVVQCYTDASIVQGYTSPDIVLLYTGTGVVETQMVTELLPVYTGKREVQPNTGTGVVQGT
jgi:hypothetical protein